MAKLVFPSNLVGVQNRVPGRKNLMRVAPFVILTTIGLTTACASQWVLVTENETTQFYLDSKEGSRLSETTWQVRERFLDKSTDRWYVEAEVRYDCAARTFMTVTIKEFSEFRPQRNAAPIEGNLPVEVVPGSHEAARLDAVCSLFEGG